MSASQTDIRTLHSKADDSVLETLEQNLRHVKATFDAEQVAFEAARMRFEQAKEVLASVQARFDGYAAIVSEQRAKMRKIPALSTEILCAIFEAACPPHIINPWALGEPTPVHSLKQRSTTPFRLSAVCKRWRTVATTSGSLWNLIAIPEDGDNSERASRSVAYIMTVAQRSKSVDLAVIIDWVDVESVEQSDGCTRMLAALAPHLQRVVSLEIHVGCCGAWMNLFRRPTPRLTTLFCVVSQPSDAWDDTPLPRYLPIAPKLDTLRLSHVPLIPQGSLPALRRLALKLAFVPSDIITTVFANAPTLTLTHLTLVSVDVFDAPAAIRQVIAPSLNSLHLSDAAVRIFAQPNVNWQLPQVTYLTINIMHMDIADQVLAIIHPTLTGMTLDGPGILRDSIAESFLPLAKLQTLLIRSCTVADDFWRALCKTDKIVLPTLTSITLDVIDLFEGDEGIFETGDGLIQFVRERRRNGSTAVLDVAQLRTVRSLTIKQHGSLSAWLVDEVNYIMTSPM